MNSSSSKSGTSSYQPTGEASFQLLNKGGSFIQETPAYPAQITAREGRNWPVIAPRRPISGPGNWPEFVTGEARPR